MHHKQPHTDYLRTAELANYWSISARTLERWRYDGKGPIFFKMEGLVRYRMIDVLEYEKHSIVRN
tara:strand:- start:264 stop:458 length:195 start_codon:yes stop_codon:yes gene_type:complete